VESADVPSPEIRSGIRLEISSGATGRGRIVARSIAIVLGTFTLANLIGETRIPGFDASFWWIDLRGFPPVVALPFLGVSAIALLAVGLGSPVRDARRIGTTLVLGLLIGVSAWNAVAFVLLWCRGTISSSFPVPFSGVVVVSLFMVWAKTCRGHGGRPRVAADAITVSAGRARRWRLRAVLGWAPGLGACLVVLALAQVFCFGKTDYRRRADAIVVFGCLAHADGSPSTSLADRVRTGCELYLQKFANRIVFSGGPSAGGVHETEVMRDLALDLGVPADAIVLDPRGLNTRATVMNTSDLFEQTDVDSVLAVSHFYHLSRIKLSYQRRGVDAYTVPAKETRWVRGTPLSVAREVLALWWYYLRPLVT